MTHPVDRLADVAETIRKTRTLERLHREVALAVAAEHGRGMARAARLDADAYVAGIALSNVAQLSADEARFVQLLPRADGRLKSVVDAYAERAAGEVAHG